MPTKDTRVRPWLKQRLPEGQEAKQAIRIHERWKKMRSASVNLVRAIRVYDALLRGDREQFQKLTSEYFPWFNLMSGVASPPSNPVMEHTPISEPPKPKLPKPRIVMRSNAKQDNDDDDDGMGFGGLDIGAHPSDSDVDH